jgi:hypothetical protein
LVWQANPVFGYTTAEPITIVAVIRKLPEEGLKNWSIMAIILMRQLRKTLNSKTGSVLVIEG